VRMSRGLRPSERTELWLWAWSYSPEPRLAETAAPALH
jgi:hypothetical protein